MVVAERYDSVMIQNFTPAKSLIDREKPRAGEESLLVGRPVLLPDLAQVSAYVTAQSELYV